MAPIEVKFDHWREDIIWPDGTVVEDILFIRGSFEAASYLTPVFPEDEDNLEDIKELLREMVTRKDLGERIDWELQHRSQS